jgi:hypothetical protein
LYCVTLSALFFVNQRRPSGLVVIPNGPAGLLASVADSLIVPDGVIRPSLEPAFSVNQSLPSLAATIRVGWLPGLMPVENVRTVTASAEGANKQVAAMVIAATPSVLARAAAVHFPARRNLIAALVAGCVPATLSDRSGTRLDFFREVRKLSGQPAFGCYLPDVHAAIARPYGLIVLTLEGDAIAAITWFADTGIFRHFGLPRTLPSL